MRWEKAGRGPLSTRDGPSPLVGTSEDPDDGAMVARGGGQQSSVKRPLIFLQDFVDVTCPFDVVRERFDGDGSWLGPLASAAETDGELLRMRIGPSWGGGRVTQEVQVTLGPNREHDDALIVTFAWDVSTLRSLIPSLDGDIEVAPLGEDRCRVTLSAAYRPPLGELGARLDRALLHRVAASTVRSFLSRVAASVQDGVEIESKRGVSGA